MPVRGKVYLMCLRMCLRCMLGVSCSAVLLSAATELKIFLRQFHVYSLFILSSLIGNNKCRL
jgi:hypothetical protein